MAENKTLQMNGESTNYRLTSDGRIGIVRMMKTRVNKDGFVTISLSIQGKRRVHLLHMLMARTFLANPLGRTHVRFKDGNKLNCALENLEWV